MCVTQTSTPERKKWSQQQVIISAFTRLVKMFLNCVFLLAVVLCGSSSFFSATPEICDEKYWRNSWFIVFWWQNQGPDAAKTTFSLQILLVTSWRRFAGSCVVSRKQRRPKVDRHARLHELSFCYGTEARRCCRWYFQLTYLQHTRETFFSITIKVTNNHEVFLKWVACCAWCLWFSGFVCWLFILGGTIVLHFRACNCQDCQRCRSCHQ